MNDKKYYSNFNAQTYQTRIYNYKNDVEMRFRAYVASVNYLCRALHLNAVSDNESYAESIIKNFSKLPTILKSFPDFFVYAPEKSEKEDQFFVELKNATWEHGKIISKIKLRDIKRYCLFEQTFTNKWTRFTICYPLKDGKMIFKSIDQILRLISKSELKKFPNDGIEYFEVQLN